jgi:hypothetical protein
VRESNPHRPVRGLPVFGTGCHARWRTFRWGPPPGRGRLPRRGSGARRLRRRGVPRETWTARSIPRAAMQGGWDGLARSRQPGLEPGTTPRLRACVHVGGRGGTRTRRASRPARLATGVAVPVADPSVRVRHGCVGPSIRTRPPTLRTRAGGAPRRNRTCVPALPWRCPAIGPEGPRIRLPAGRARLPTGSSLPPGCVRTCDRLMASEARSRGGVTGGS